MVALAHLDRIKAQRLAESLKAPLPAFNDRIELLDRLRQLFVAGLTEPSNLALLSQDLAQASGIRAPPQVQIQGPLHEYPQEEGAASGAEFSSVLTGARFRCTPVDGTKASIAKQRVADAECRHSLVRIRPLCVSTIPA
jgi:hypothetical protein